jgi:hypothetical protein
MSTSSLTRLRSALPRLGRKISPQVRSMMTSSAATSYVASLLPPRRQCRPGCLAYGFSRLHRIGPSARARRTDASRLSAGPGLCRLARDW